MKAIKKVIFKAQNTGDNVKVNTAYFILSLVLNGLQIAIPYSAILDVDRSTAMDFSETIEVKVVDKEDHFAAIDSYFFAYFRDLPGALDQIRDAVRTYRASCILPENSSPPAVLDTTVSRTPTTDSVVHALPEPASPKATSGFRLASIFRPFADSLAVVNRPSTLPSELQNDYTHVSRKLDSSSFIPITTSPTTMSSNPTADAPSSPKPNESNSIMRHSTQSLPPPDHTYPPSTPSSSISPNNSYLSRDDSNSWAVGVPSWLRSSRRVFGPSQGNPTATFNSSLVREVYSSATSLPGPISRPSSAGEMTFSILETPDMKPDQETAEKFRAAFAYDDKETLLGCAYCATVSLHYTDQNISTPEQIFRDISIGSFQCSANCTSQQISFVSSRVDL